MKTFVLLKPLTALAETPITPSEWLSRPDVRERIAALKAPLVKLVRRTPQGLEVQLPIALMFVEEYRLPIEVLPPKPCKHCGQTKPLSQFGSDRSRPDGRNFYCLVCHSTRVGEWKARNPEKVREMKEAEKAKRVPKEKPAGWWLPK